MARDILSRTLIFSLRIVITGGLFEKGFRTLTETVVSYWLSTFVTRAAASLNDTAE
jgi:hypothetical protein